MKSISVNNDELMKFLRDFDPIDFKYSVFKSSLGISTSARSILSEYEDMFRFGSLTKSDYSGIVDNVRLVYGDKQIVKDDIELYHQAEKKIVHQYLAIPELDRMFDEDYFNFEWDMHVGQNFSEHRNNYYRDHFLHQIRDAYMMFVMLKELDFCEASKKILSEASIGKISEYVCIKRKQFMLDKLSPFHQIRNSIIESENCLCWDELLLEIICLIEEIITSLNQCKDSCKEKNIIDILSIVSAKINKIEMRVKSSWTFSILDYEKKRILDCVQSIKTAIIKKQIDISYKKSGDLLEEFKSLLSIDCKVLLEKKVSYFITKVNELSQMVTINEKDKRIIAKLKLVDSYNMEIERAEFIIEYTNKIKHIFLTNENIQREISKSKKKKNAVSEVKILAKEIVFFCEHFIWECVYKKPDVYSEHYFYKYIIYASAFLSGMFHDLGYPICHFLQIRHRLSEYNPSLYMFTNNALNSFDQIAAKLGSSLLFTIVSISEIKNRVQNINKRGEYDHGTYSAIAFLLQFYESGIIHNLSPEKQCAIELAAVAIYNHTAKYKATDNKNATSYYQPVFRQNPISFLLRVCDDLQEWERRYFEISDDTDLMFCSTCGAPLISNDDIVRNSNYTNLQRRYRCMCNKKMWPHKYQSFLKRKVYIVRNSDSMEFCNNDTGILEATIKYDYYCLLKMARINYTYATFRLKELNEIKSILKYQNIRFQSDESVPYIGLYLNYFMTSNPILIKIKLLERYISYDKCFLGITDNVLKKEKLCNVFKKNAKNRCLNFKKTTKSIDDVLRYLGGTNDKAGALLFYLELLDLSIKEKVKYNTSINVWNEEIIRENLENNAEVGDFINRFCENTNSNEYKHVMTTLIYDCLFQYAKEPQDINVEYINSKRYMEQYKPQNEKELNNSVLRYCCKDSDFNNYDLRYGYNNRNGFIGYYSDLLFFDILNRIIDHDER